MFAIVMAGGSGTRLWPLSRRRNPKQLLNLTGDTSLLQQTVARVGTLLKPHDIYVITSQAHVRATQDQLPQLPADNVLGEPLARSTAVAAGLATVLARRESDEVAFVLPADHHVADEEAFVAGLREAARAAERGYLWNAGIFVWRVYAFRKAVERFQPRLAEALDRIASLDRTPGWMSHVRDLLEALSQARGADLAASGRHLDRGSHTVLVHGGDRLIVTGCLEDVIIVDTP